MDYAYFDGGFIPLSDAKISIRTHAFLYGTALFEGIRGYWLPESNSVSIFGCASIISACWTTAKSSG